MLADQPAQFVFAGAPKPLDLGKGWGRPSQVIAECTSAAPAVGLAGVCTATRAEAERAEHVSVG